MTDPTPNENESADSVYPVLVEMHAPAEPAAPAAPRKPGMAGYWIAIALLVFAAADGSVMVGKIFELMGREFHVAPAGERAFLELSQPGEYTVFNMVRYTFGGKVHSGPEALPTMSCKLATETGLIKVRAADGQVSLKTETMSCESIWTFEIDEAGTYVFETTFTSPSDESRILFGISKTFAMGDIGVIIGLGIVLVPMILVAVIVAVITFRRRSAAGKAPMRTRRRTQRTRNTKRNTGTRE